MLLLPTSHALRCRFVDLVDLKDDNIVGLAVNLAPLIQYFIDTCALNKLNYLLTYVLQQTILVVDELEADEA